MSVLIEALTLVVRKQGLERAYPGGTAAFLAAARALARPPRFACEGDEHFVNVSFYDPEHMRPCLELLRAHGLGRIEDDAFVDAACVDQIFGPTRGCDWLRWAEDEDGITRAWLATEEPRELATDDQWTAARSLGLVHRERVDVPGRLLRLAEEDGVEFWLDQTTGKQLVGLAHPASGPAGVPEGDANAGFLGDAALEPIVRRAPPSGEARPESGDGDAPPEEDPAEVEARIDRLRTRIVEVLQAEELYYEPHGPLWVAVPFTAANLRGSVRVGPSENGKVVRVYTCTEMCVPAERRAAACEALMRANYGLPVGGFEMDLRDGEVVFKGSIFLADGELGDGQLAESIGGGIYLYDRYYPALMRVVFGGASPEQAIAEVER